MNSREFRALGRVGADNVQAVLHRLRGVCDNAAVGGAPFRERELYYQISESQATLESKLTLALESATFSLSLIARKSLLDEKSPWLVRREYRIPYLLLLCSGIFAIMVLLNRRERAPCKIGVAFRQPLVNSCLSFCKKWDFCTKFSIVFFCCTCFCLGFKTNWNLRDSVF